MIYPEKGNPGVSGRYRSQEISTGIKEVIKLKMFLVIKCQKIPNGSKSKAIDNKYISRHSISSHRVHPGAVVPVVIDTFIKITHLYIGDSFLSIRNVWNRICSNTKIWQFLVMLSCCLTWISACCMEMHIPPPYSVLLFTKKKFESTVIDQ